MKLRQVVGRTFLSAKLPRFCQRLHVIPAKAGIQQLLEKTHNKRHRMQELRSAA
jgi:hypothetical protein